jgi:uncharacterized membrane protein (UPF0127 family)
MASTPDRGERLVLLIGAVLAVGGIAALLVAVVAGNDSGDPAPPIARSIRSALGNAAPATEPFAGLTEVELALGDDCLRLVVADDDLEKSDGLRGREATAPYDGMLFLFDDTHQASFTMQGVSAPLAIGWYGADGRPIDRAEMVPCPQERTDCPPYSSTEPYRFAVETAGGALAGGALGGCPS